MIYTALQRTLMITLSPLKKSGGDLMCSGRVNSSCSNIGTRRVTLVTKSEISHE